MIKAEFNKDTNNMEVLVKGDQDVVSVELVALEAAIYKLITNKKPNDE